MDRGRNSENLVTGPRDQLLQNITGPHTLSLVRSLLDFLKIVKQNKYNTLIFKFLFFFLLAESKLKVIMKAESNSFKNGTNRLCIHTAF